MHNLDFAKARLPASACLFAAIGLSTFLPLIEEAHAQGECGTSFGVSPLISPISGSKVIVGQTITITRFTAFSDVGNCLFRNGVAYYAHPDGSVVQTLADLSLDPGQTKNCPADNGSGLVCMPFPATYVVNAADINRTLTIVLPPRGQFGGGTFVMPGNPGQINFFGAGDIDIFNPGDPSSPIGAVAAQAQQILRVVAPHITITKECVNPCTPYGDPIQFLGQICNDGDTTLTNIIASNVPAATITFATNKSNGQPFTPSTGLAAGECVNYSGSYQPAGTGAELCGPFTDTSIVTGTAQSVFQNPTFSATNSATCFVCTSPGCPPAPPVIVLNPITNGTNFSFTFMTETNRTNTIQFIDSLLLTNWQMLTTFIAVGGITNVVDNMTSTQRFYRVKVE